ncbi:uncharacterized protein LOC131636008 [Vicia villosa]|uniref:uncharacterized protein LOC131636008 n=1 Tax=Vicia villosa TaxID=3911 RepID=UPI00273BEE64|nr:uncharacterized protein LOC131636008 [Vicia villosa]
MSNMPWCIIGDFNDLLSQEDKHGCQFTWVKSRGSEHMMEERLDQAFAAPQWLNLFPTVSLTNLIASHLDHSPILLSCKTVQTLRRDIKFRFKNSWLQENDIGSVIQSGWRYGDDNIVVDHLSSYAESLEVWSRRKRNSRKEDLGKNLEVMEMFREGRDKYSSDRFFKARTEYNQALIREDAYWKQQAKMHWLRDGDMNTNGVYEPVLRFVNYITDNNDNHQLLQPLTREELRTALFAMHPDKSSGPDGFNPAFFQNFWEGCGNDIFEAASAWIEHGFFPPSINDTNICLIPKGVNFKSMKDFRPISLCNMVYKVVSKAFVNRLDILLDKCVFEEQPAFVEGRSNLNNAMISTEVIHTLKRRTKGNKVHLALKIDISKAYDRVDWGFLRGVLAKMGFLTNGYIG